MDKVMENKIVTAVEGVRLNYLEVEGVIVEREGSCDKCEGDK
jgi:hypothetical protein